MKVTARNVGNGKECGVVKNLPNLSHKTNGISVLTPSESRPSKPTIFVDNNLYEYQPKNHIWFNTIISAGVYKIHFSYFSYFKNQ